MAYENIDKVPFVQDYEKKNHRQNSNPRIKNLQKPSFAQAHNNSKQVKKLNL